MPVRVKCRCGRELVLRYGEWVYVLLGLLLVGLAANVVITVLLWLRFAALEGDGEATGVAASRVEAPEAGANGSDGERAAESDAGTGAAARDGAGRAVDSSPGAETLPEDAGDEDARREEPRAEATAPQQSATGRRLVEGEGGATVLDVLDALAPSFDRSSSGTTAPSPAAPASAASDVRRSQETPRCLLPGAERLLRLWVLEDGREDARLVLTFLLDPDPWLRERAALLLGERRDLAGVLAEDDLAALVETALPALDGDARAMLAGLAAPPTTRTVREREEAVERELAERRAAIASVLESPAARALDRVLARWRASGVDLALIVDVSASMAEPLSALQRAADWWIPAFLWAAPGGRIALVLYRDDVEEHADFSELPLEEILPALRRAKAEGGGDVPEGVHVALRRALELGVLTWRRDAEKHVVFLADAPPPYRAGARAGRLAEQAFRQGGYRLHGIVVETDEESRPLPFFRELTSSAGGQLLTPSLDAIGEAILSSLLGEEEGAQIAGVTRSLRDGFDAR